MKNKDKTNQLIMTNFTDPICTWCWGSEPVYRKLETHYPDKIEYRYIMGGLVDDILKFKDDKNHIGGDGAKQANTQIIKHWEEASSRHGMPVRSEGFALFSNEYPSTYPQNIAYKAAQKIDEKKANALLRRIREATATQAQITSNENVLANLAAEVGFNKQEFLTKYRSGEARGAFNGDLYINQTLGVTGFPTTEIKYNNEKIMLRGYHPYEHYVEAISKLTQGEVMPIKPEVSEDQLFILMKKTPYLAAEEIRQAFDFDSIKQVDNWVDELMSQNLVKKVVAGNGYFITAVNKN